MDRDDETPFDRCLRTANVLTALALEMEPHPFRLPKAPETPHTEEDQPGHQMGKPENGNNEKNGRR